MRALGSGVDSFLVVIGDTVPHVDHLAHHYEIVEHLKELENLLTSKWAYPPRFREWQFRRRIELGAQFFVTGPILDPEVMERHLGLLNLKPEDPPVFVMIIPPFSSSWVEQMEAIGQSRLPTN